MNMNSQSNISEDNRAKATASGGLEEKPCRNDSLARLNLELRTPLNAIMGFTKQLEMQSDNASVTDNVRQFLKAAHQLLDAINQEDAEPGHAHANAQCDVLHIEDDSINLMSLKLLLGNTRKLKILQATSGQSGLALAKTHDPKLILLDLDLPDIHGSEVIQLLQKEPATARIPVIVLSGDTTPSQIERLLVLGARNYLTKPFQPQALLAVVDTVLEETARSTAGLQAGEHASQFAPAQDKPR
jgi:CheY-like chemotaxis protein